MSGFLPMNDFVSANLMKYGDPGMDWGNSQNTSTANALAANAAAGNSAGVADLMSKLQPQTSSLGGIFGEGEGGILGNLFGDGGIFGALGNFGQLYFMSQLLGEGKKNAKFARNLATTNLENQQTAYNESMRQRSAKMGMSDNADKYRAAGMMDYKALG